jgi:hypothetical protein
MRLIRAKFRIKNSILGRFCKFGRFFALKMGCSCCRVMECEPFVVEFWQVSMLAALGIGFNPTKFKPQMNMAIQRFRLVRQAWCFPRFSLGFGRQDYITVFRRWRTSFLQQIQKKAEEVQRDKREIMQLLTARKFDSARIRVREWPVFDRFFLGQACVPSCPHCRVKQCIGSNVKWRAWKSCS